MKLVEPKDFMNAKGFLSSPFSRTPVSVLVGSSFEPPGVAVGAAAAPVGRVQAVLSALIASPSLTSCHTRQSAASKVRRAESGAQAAVGPWRFLPSCSEGGLGGCYEGRSGKWLRFMEDCAGCSRTMLFAINWGARACTGRFQAMVEVRSFLTPIVPGRSTNRGVRILDGSD